MRLIIVGAGGYGRVIAEIVEQSVLEHTNRQQGG